MNRQTKFMAGRLMPLVGQKIDGIVYDESGEFPVVGLRLASGAVVWILCDPEGNGPGHLEIQEKE